MIYVGNYTPLMDVDWVWLGMIKHEIDVVKPMPSEKGVCGWWLLGIPTLFQWPALYGSLWSIIWMQTTDARAAKKGYIAFCESSLDLPFSYVQLWLVGKSGSWVPSAAMGRTQLNQKAALFEAWLLELGL